MPPELDPRLEEELRHRIDRKTKPVGALGRLEDLALRLGLVQGTTEPRIERPTVVVLAGDHGIAREGVSAYPPDVTWQMVENFLAGGAAVNALARVAGMEVVVADAGVDHDFGPREGLVDIKVRRGTRSFLRERAMTPEECQEAMRRGAELVRGLVERGTNVVAFGEMGIGNTSAASAVLSALEDVPLEVSVGRGTGLDDAGLARKRDLLGRALAFHRARWAEEGRRADPLEVLATFGGYEMAAMAGGMLEAPRHRALVLVDGFIATASFLVAARLDPALLEYAVFAHRSDERGHAAMLELLGARPLLALDMRLGEGTGAVLALPLLRAAEAFLRDMASFESAGVSDRVG